MEDYSTVSRKTEEQLRKFLGGFSPHLSKPRLKFLGDMLYGVQAAGDVKLSEIARELRPGSGCSPKKKEERLSRHLAAEDLTGVVGGVVLADARRYVDEDTLVVVDPTDLQKRYARRMEGLSKVYDGSRGDVGEGFGYTGVMAVACTEGDRLVVPLHLSFWSKTEKGFTSDNDRVHEAIRAIAGATGSRGVYVYDRGGDDAKLFRLYRELGVDFIVRAVGSRKVRSWRRLGTVEEFARSCPMRYRDRVETEGVGGRRGFTIEYGVIPVRLDEDGLRDEVFHLVVVKPLERCEEFPDMKPMMLLTTLAEDTSRRSLARVVNGYYRRWLVEETIRYLKQSYRLEDVRVMTLRSLRNMAAIVLAAAYFACVWLGRRVKRGLIVRALLDMSQRMGRLGGFVCGALAHGIRRAFVRGGRWRGLDVEESPKIFDDRQMLLDLSG